MWREFNTLPAINVSPRYVRNFCVQKKLRRPPRLKAAESPRFEPQSTRVLSSVSPLFNSTLPTPSRPDWALVSPLAHYVLSRQASP